MELKDILDQNKMPWPEVVPPQIKPGKYDTWEVVETPHLPILRGYFIGLQIPKHPNLCLRDAQSTIWMSLTPMELESMAPHIHYASGHTVIAGGGMGVAMACIMKKDSVKRVTVIEKDPKIIELITHWARTYEWPGRDKIRFIKGDARTLINIGPIDYMYVDIWSNLMSPKALKETQKIQHNLKASRIGYWGQELDFISFIGTSTAGTEHRQPPPPTKMDYHRWRKKIQLPIVIQNADQPWYWSLQAAENVYRY